MSMVAAQLAAAARAGGGIPYRERHIAARAFFVRLKKTHSFFSIPWISTWSNRDKYISDFLTQILAYPNRFVKGDMEKRVLTDTVLPNIEWLAANLKNMVQ
jgi:hypothetical protein